MMTFLPIKTKTYQTGKCICGMGMQCKKLKTLFRDAGDIRGQLFRAPNIASTSRHKNQKDTSEQWLKRTAHHWKTTSYQSLSEQCNQKEKVRQPLSSRTREQLNRQNQLPKKTKRVLTRLIKTTIPIGETREYQSLHIQGCQKNRKCEI